MKAKSSKKPATKAKPAASLRDLTPRKDAKGGAFRDPTELPPGSTNHNETLVVG